MGCHREKIIAYGRKQTESILRGVGCCITQFLELAQEVCVWIAMTQSDGKHAPQCYETQSLCNLNYRFHLERSWAHHGILSPPQIA